MSTQTVVLNQHTKWQELRTRFYKTRYLQLLALPGLLYFLVFRYLPIYGIVLGFKNYQVGELPWQSDWAANGGFEHFLRFFNYVYFWRLIKNTLLLSIYGIAFAFPIPIILALLLNELRSKYYKRSLQTIMFLPHFISTPAIVGMLFLLLSPQSGVLNSLLGVIGIEPIYFMARPEWFRPVFIGSNIWQNAGWGAIVYIATLSGVSPELYESATVDGANRVQKMWHISLPSILPVVMLLLVLQFGRLLSENTQKILLMYSELNYETADVIGTYVYRRGLQFAEYSFGVAVGLFNSLANVIMLILSDRVAKRLSGHGLW